MFINSVRGVIQPHLPQCIPKSPRQILTRLCHLQACRQSTSWIKTQLSQHGNTKLCWSNAQVEITKEASSLLPPFAFIWHIVRCLTIKPEQ